MFTPTAEKLIPDLSAARGARGAGPRLWREGYNDHLAGHITYRQPDGTLLCNPWLSTWAELRPVTGAAHRPRRERVVEGDWPVPLGIPLHLELHKRAPGRAVGGAQPPTLRHRLGRPGARCPRSSTRARPSGAASLVLVDEYEGPVNDAESPARTVPWRWATPPWPSSPATASSCSAGPPAPCTSAPWHSNSAAATPGTSRPPAGVAHSRTACRVLPQSDGNKFIGFWEATVRVELEADPTLPAPIVEELRVRRKRPRHPASGSGAHRARRLLVPDPRSNAAASGISGTGVTGRSVMNWLEPAEMTRHVKMANKVRELGVD